MSEFLAFVLIIFMAVWGSVFLGIMAKKYLERGDDSEGPDLIPEGVREDMLLLEARLTQVEEELSFYRQLNEGTARQLPAEPDDD